MIGNSDDETNFPHKLLLTNGQVTIVRKNKMNINCKMNENP